MLIRAKKYENIKTDSEHFAPEMSQCSPRGDNGYPKASGSDGADGDVTDANGSNPYPILPSADCTVQFRQVKLDLPLSKVLKKSEWLLIFLKQFLLGK